MRKVLLVLLVVLSPYLIFGQSVVKKNEYIIGEDGKLQFTVHIWGEVRNPGEYIVSDKTDLLELISKAGGPTEYSNLKNVKITRGLLSITSSSGASQETYRNIKINQASRKKIVKINLQNILEKRQFEQLLPILEPGDVVQVGKNKWFKWQTVIRVVSQLAIVAQVYWYWNRD